MKIKIRQVSHVESGFVAYGNPVNANGTVNSSDISIAEPHPSETISKLKPGVYELSLSPVKTEPAAGK